MIYLFGGETLYRMFFEEDHIVAYGVQIIHVIIFIVLFQVSQVIYMGCLRGAGDTAYTAMASTVSVTVIRTLFSYVCGIALGWGITGIWLGVLDPVQGGQVDQDQDLMSRYSSGAMLSNSSHAASRSRFCSGLSWS